MFARLGMERRNETFEAGGNCQGSMGGVPSICRGVHADLRPRWARRKVGGEALGTWILLGIWVLPLIAGMLLVIL
jgi:hypothetical protein